MTDGAEDPVERNRATPRRGAPGRGELGAGVTRRVRRLTLLAIGLATAVLVVVVLAAR